MNHSIKEPREFKEELRRYEPTDRGHADTFNAVAEVLINNDAYLKERVEGQEGSREQLTEELRMHAGDQDRHVTAEKQSAWDAKAENRAATAEADGLMSAGDKAKLDSVAAGAAPPPESYPASAITAGTFPGQVTANSNTAYTTRQVRNIVMSTSTGASTQNGDVLHVYS